MMNRIVCTLPAYALGTDIRHLNRSEPRDSFDLRYSDEDNQFSGDVLRACLAAGIPPAFPLILEVSMLTGNSIESPVGLPRQ